MIPIIEIEALLGYVEVDIKNGVQMNVPDWQNAVEKIRAWLDPQRSPTTRAPVQTDQDLAFYPGEFCGHGYNGICPFCDAMQTPPNPTRSIGG